MLIKRTFCLKNTNKLKFLYKNFNYEKTSVFFAFCCKHRKYFTVQKLIGNKRVY